MSSFTENQPRGSALIPLALVVRLALPLIGAVMAPMPAYAEAASFNIPAGDLGESLNRFALQAGIAIVYRTADLKGLSSPGLKGTYEVEEGFSHLLSGSGYQALKGEHGYQLEKVPAKDAALEMSSSTITGQAETAFGPVQGFVAKRSATGTKTDTSILETPQTINVITQDEIKARGAQSVTEALRYTPGIQVEGFSARVKAFDEPTSRGFSPTPLYLDSLHLPYGGGSTGGALQIDPYLLERVEVLKGPASVLYGQNQPGGIVNMVSKRPTVVPLHEVVLGGGSYDRRYGAFDFGGALDEEGQVLYRLTAVGNDTNSEVDYAKQQRFVIAPSLTWNLSDQTSLTLYSQYQKDNDVPEPQGLPTVGTLYDNPNGRIDRDRFIGEPGVNAYDREQYAVGYEFSHVLNDIWTLKQNARYAYVDDRFRAVLHGYSFATNPTTGANDQRYLDRYAIDWSQTNKVYGIDNMAQAVFNTAQVNHTLLIGVDYYHFNSKFLGLYDRSPPSIDLYAPVYGQPIDFTKSPANPWDNTITQTGVYLQDQMKWEQWFVTLGGRFDWAETDNKQPLYGGHTNTKDQQFSGRAGFGYLFENGLTPYFSYSESFQPVSGTDVDSKPFDASTGKQYEVGVKYQPPGQDSFIQLSMYQIDKQNVLTSDLDNPGFSTQSGELRSRGVELEGKASLSERVNLVASVSRVDAEYTKDNDGLEGRHPIGVSPLTASAWLDYHWPEGTALAGLGMGIGARYVRHSPGTSTSYNEFEVPSFTVYDGMVSYDFAQSPLHIKGVKLQANIENLDNKLYVSRCSGVWECTYGQGRTVTANLTYDW